MATAATSGQSEADGIDEDDDEPVTDSKMPATRRTGRSRDRVGCRNSCRRK